jgi:glucosylceramidase
LDVTAFKNPDGSIVVVFLNRNSERLPVVIRLNEEIVEFEVEAEAIVTGVIRRSTR